MLVTGAKQKMIDNPTYYSDLLTSVPDNYVNPYNSKIELDVKRSFPREYSHIIDDDKLNILRNILRAFSIKNTTLGYCQGYNIILARILLVTGFNEEISFWIFVSIIEDVFPYDFFLQSAGIEIDCQLSLDLLKEHNEELYSYMEAKGGINELYSYIMKWLISLFITDIDFDVSNAIIDLLLYFKSTQVSIAMYVVVDTIFKQCGKILSQLTNDDEFDGVSSVIDSLLNPNSSDDKRELIQNIINALMKFDHPICDKHITIIQTRTTKVNEVITRIKETMKHKVRTLIEESHNNSNNSNSKRTNENVKCDLKYPCCVKDVAVKFEINDFIVGKIDFQNGGACVMDNYFFEGKSIMEQNQIDETSILKHQVFAGLCIERRDHYCMSDVSSKPKTK